MNNRYVLLRNFDRLESISPPSAGGLRVGLTSRPLSVNELEVVEVAPSDLRTIARDPTIDVAAPVMPMALPKKILETKDPAMTSAGDAAWGVEAVGAIGCPFDGRNVRVAVLDTGIAKEHDAFAGMELYQKNYTDEPDEHDTHGHGTHCAGTIFGRDVSGKRIGVARGVQHAFIGKVLGRGGGGTDIVAEAIRDAVDWGAQIISMSLGIDFPGFVAKAIARGAAPDYATALGLSAYRANIRLFDRLARLIDAEARMARREVVLVAACGNESRRDENPDYEFPAAPPSEAEMFVAVGAVGPGSGAELVLAPFSNTGCEVVGPGVRVLSAGIADAQQLVGMSGTSMATPHVAGVAALWVEALRPRGHGVFPRQLQLRSRLVGNASQAVFGNAYDPYDLGAGLIQAPTSRIK